MTTYTIRHCAGSGDLLMFTPAFRGVKEQDPSCQIRIATLRGYCAGAFDGLLAENPHVDGVSDVGESNGNMRHWLAAGDVKFFDLGRKCAQYEDAFGPKHRTDLACDLLDVAPDSRKPVLNLRPEEIAWAQGYCQEHYDMSGPVIGIVTDGSCDARRIPEITVAEIAALALDAGWEAILLNRDTGLTIRQYAALMTQLTCLVTPDTGAMHMAGALDVPTVALFGPTDPLSRMKYYPHCHALKADAMAGHEAALIVETVGGVVHGEL